MTKTISRYTTNAYQQTCTCVAGQYGRMCKHLRAASLAAAEREAYDEAQLIAARARWAASEAAWRSARTAELARNPWAASYPGTD